VLAVLGACTVPAESPPRADRAAAAVDDSASRAARSDELLERTLSPDEPGCSAAVGVEGEVVWAGARGLADLATGRALTPSTTLDVASVSKQFTATAVLLLAQEGRLALDDPLSRWVPGLPAWSNEVTLDHLMHHTSAIPDYLLLVKASGHELSERTTQQQARGHRPAPVAQRTPERPVRLLQFQLPPARRGRPAGGAAAPAGLRPHPHLRAPGAGDGHRSLRRQPRQHRPVVGPQLRSEPNEWTVGAGRVRWEQIGDGSIQTTPSELVRWADNYRTGRLGGSQLVDAQLRGTTPTGPGGDRYAAGIIVTPDGALTHTGDWAGFLTTFHVAADRRIAVAVTCNHVDNRPPSDIEEITDQLQAEWAEA
jgi:CubicO group peptidase (beta-lactamase class C family)